MDCREGCAMNSLSKCASLTLGLILTLAFQLPQARASSVCPELFESQGKSKCLGICPGETPHLLFQDSHSWLREFNNRSVVAKIYLLVVDPQSSGERYKLYDGASAAIFEGTNLVAVQDAIAKSLDPSRKPWISIQGRNSQRVAATRASILATWKGEGTKPRVFELVGHQTERSPSVETIPHYLLAEARVRSVSDTRAISSGERNGWHGFVVRFNGFVLRVYARTAELARQLRLYFVGANTSSNASAIDFVTQAIIELRKQNPELSEADVRVEFQNQVGTSFVADARVSIDASPG